MQLAISYNHAANPDRIHFDNTSLDAVFFDNTFVWGKNSGEDEGEEIPPEDWPSDFPSPPSMPSVITLTRNNNKIWLRDFYCTRYYIAFIVGESGLWYAYTYHGDCTVNIDVSMTTLCGITNTPGNFYVGEYSSTKATVSGVPSGYTIGDILLERPVNTITLGLWNYYISPQGYAVKTTKAGRGLFEITNSSIINDDLVFQQLETSTSYNGDYLVFCDEVNSWGYSGSCGFTLFKPM